VLARSASAAFAAEPELAAAIIGTDATTPAQPALPDPLPLDLLSGEYAQVARWQPDRTQLKRLALLAAAVAGLWLGSDVAALLRASSAASAADAELMTLAPSTTDGPSAFAALQAQAQQRGAAGGLAALAGPVVQALSARPGAGLAGLSYTPAGGLVAGVAGGGGEAKALADALGIAGLAASPGTTPRHRRRQYQRSDGAREMMAMISPWWAQRTSRERWLIGMMLALLAALLFWLVLVRPLAAARATAQADAGAAAARLAQGQALAAAIKARPAANPAAVIDVLNRRLADAGLQPARLEAQGPGQASLEIAAINGRLLIGWATALEQNDGLVIEQLEATRNPDQSVRARLLVRSAQ
jgi:general secretion pathway protein M